MEYGTYPGCGSTEALPTPREGCGINWPSYPQQPGCVWDQGALESGNQTPMQNMQYKEENRAHSSGNLSDQTPQHNSKSRKRERRSKREVNVHDNRIEKRQRKDPKKDEERAYILKRIALLIDEDALLIDEDKMPPEVKTSLLVEKRKLMNRGSAQESRERARQKMAKLEKDNDELCAEKDQWDNEKASILQEVQALRAELHEAKFFGEHLMQENMRLQQENRDCKEMIHESTNREGQQNKIIRQLTDHLHSLMTIDEDSYDEGAIDDPPATFGEDIYFDTVGFSADPVIKPDVVAVEPPKPAAQGLLLMILLFGAFVASKGNYSTAVPPVSDDMREASACILNDVFSEAGLSNTVSMTGFNPVMSAPINSWNDPPTTHVTMAQITLSGFPSLALDDFDGLSQPSIEQQREQLLAMSPEQVNDLTHPGFMNGAPAVMASSSGRRNLAESLAAMRSGKGKKTEVYTRSLLWDQVPQDVVLRFAQMVAGYDTGVNPGILG